jgi:hypothetical protein
MQAPPSTSSILTYKDTTSELNRLKSVMTAKRTDWDTRTTIPGSRFFSPKHKLATAMSKVYGSLGELASAYGSPSVYDLRYHNFTKAEKALTSAKAESQLTLEDETQLKNYKSDVIFTVFASIATREEDSKIVDFEPCRTASEAYFGEFCSRVSGFLHVSCRNLHSIKLMALRKRSFI